MTGSRKNYPKLKLLKRLTNSIELGNIFKSQMRKLASKRSLFYIVNI